MADDVIDARKHPFRAAAAICWVICAFVAAIPLMAFIGLATGIATLARRYHG